MQWQTIQLSLGGGVETGTDVRAADPRQMDIANDVQFDELRGAQTRKPITSGAFGSNNIFGGGTLSNCRRIETVNGELVLFTDVGAYSWNAQLSAWVLRGTHLAVTVTETPRFVTTGDQIDGDRAELNGTVVYAWTEGGSISIAAMDKVTGSVLVTPSSILTSSSRPRLVASATKIMLFFENNGALSVVALDPANPGFAFFNGPVVTVLAAGTFNLFYDVAKIDGQDLVVGACRRVTTTSYTVFAVTSATTPVVTAVTKARTCDGPIAVSSVPNGGLQTQVIRGSGTNIVGDFLTTSTLADLTVNQAVGTIPAAGTINQIAAAYRSVTTGGAFRCYAFWSSNESPSFATLFATKFNFVDTAGTLGTQATFVLGLGVASRAFSYAGSVYVWLAFGKTSVAQMDVALTNQTQAQNAFVLYRDDAFLCAKAAYGVGAGFRPSTGLLPGVALTAGSATFAWIGTTRRRLLLGGDSTAFAARDSRDVVFTFDATAARRCAVIGRTLYVAAGEVLQYDGARLVECGFHFYPFAFDMLKSGTGSVPTGTYAYKLTWRYINAQGEVERSTTATVGIATMVGGPAGFAMGQASPLTPTHKTRTAGAVAIEVWRTAVNGTPDSPFFLASNPDPTQTTAPNQYIANDPTVAFAPAAGTWRDEMTDTVLGAREANPENGTELEALCPPGASIIHATDTRLFLAGVVGDVDSVWYSRLRGAGEIASFHDGNVIPVPPDGGDITALAFLNETLIVFRQTAIYAVPGQGFDNQDGGQNFGPSNRLSSDCGAISAETVVLTPMGLVFKSRKGWYLLDRGWGVRYIGSQVAKFDGDTINAIHIVETQHQVRILTNARMLVWDYNATTDAAPIGQWAVWTISDGVHATMWNGSYVYLTATGPKIEQATYTGVTYGADVESSWIKLNDLQGAGRVGQIEVLGEYRSACLVRVRVARDYQYDGAGNVVYYDDKAWSPSPTVVGSALQVRHSPTQGQCEAIKVRITAVAAGVRASLSTAGMSGGVLTSGSNWSATFAAWDTVFAGKAFNPGEMGNAITMSLSFELAATVLIDVRDHFRYDITLGRWREDIGNVGVRITGPNAGITVNDLEGAIASATTLAQVALGDPVTTKTLNMTALNGQVVTGSFTGGTYVAPAGEALKLTGLGLEVGIKPGLYRRLPAGQKQ